MRGSQPSSVDVERSPLRIGVLVPLSRPGWTEAGRHLLAGLEVAVAEVNDNGGVAGRALELLVRDTAADPARAVAAVEELSSLGVVAVVGEYHSVVAGAAASTAADLEMVFLCSSAVIDALVDRPTDWVARLAPAQSHGWRFYADHLVQEGQTKVAVATLPSSYWSAGARIMRDHLVPRGVQVVELDASRHSPEGLADALSEWDATGLLLCVGHPDPAVDIVRAVRRDRRLARLWIGAPAGQPEFGEWETLLGGDGAGIPFLRYLPDQLSPRGLRVQRAVTQHVGAAPSFVAFEGHDTITVLVEVLRLAPRGEAGMADIWPRVAVAGTRGPIRFSRVDGVEVWQWAWAPVQIVDRDPADPRRFRVLRSVQ